MTSILVALASALLAALVIWLALRGHTGVLRERLAGRETEIARLSDELHSTQLALDELRATHACIGAELAAERATASERIQALADAHERVLLEFKSLSADALKRNNATFLELARSTLGHYQQKADGDLAARQQAIGSLVLPLKESLDRVDSKIGELEQTRARAYGELGRQLEQLSTAQLRLHSEAAKLSTALRSTSYAGSWGELQLRRVVELADMLPYCDFTTQETSADASLRADLVVRLPAGQRIVVDAKSPMQAYRDALDAPDDAGRAELLAHHAARLRSHIDALGAKNYWDQFQPAPEFVVLFLPGDHFLSAALQNEPALLERALARRVLLASPTTLIALLKAASLGWRHEAVSRNAEEISALGRQLYDRLATFAEHLEKVGRGLDGATRSYNAAIGSLEANVLVSARRLADLGAKGVKELPPTLTVDSAPRDIVRRS